MGAIPRLVGSTPSAAGMSWRLRPAARPSSTGHRAFPSAGILGHFGANFIQEGGWHAGKGYFRNCKRRHKLSCLQCKRRV